jgi:hypothetical protein
VSYLGADRLQRKSTEESRKLSVFSMVRAVLGSVRASVASFLAHCRHELQGARQGLGRVIQRGTFAQKSSNSAPKFRRKVGSSEMRTNAWHADQNSTA